MTSRLICLLSVSIPLALALTACKEEKKPAEAKTAQGEILPGSASDAMLPLDTVRSQPPLAPPEEFSDKGGKPSIGTKPGGTARAARAGGDAAEELAAAPSIAAEEIQ